MKHLKHKDTAWHLLGTRLGTRAQSRGNVDASVLVLVLVVHHDVRWAMGDGRRGWLTAEQMMHLVRADGETR